jgi:hypothetical protein
MSATDLESYPYFIPSSSSLPLKLTSLSTIKTYGVPLLESSEISVSRLLKTNFNWSFSKLTNFQLIKSVSVPDYKSFFKSITKLSVPLG